jgi:hypothetical protein
VIDTQLTGLDVVLPCPEACHLVRWFCVPDKGRPAKARASFEGLKIVEDWGAKSGTRKSTPRHGYALSRIADVLRITDAEHTDAETERAPHHGVALPTQTASVEAARA